MNSGHNNLTQQLNQEVSCMQKVRMMRNGWREEAEDVEEMKEKSPIRSLKSFQIAFHNEKLL